MSTVAVPVAEAEVGGDLEVARRPCARPRRSASWSAAMPPAATIDAAVGDRHRSGSKAMPALPSSLTMRPQYGSSPYQRALAQRALGDLAGPGARLVVGRGAR